MLAFLCLVAVLMLIYVVSTIVKPKNFPPGPRWYPVIGCSDIVNSRLAKHGSQWKVLSEMAKEYKTNLLGLKLGNELVVAVYGEKNIKFVLSEKRFDARPDTFFMRLRTFGKRIGITFVEGHLWREHRLFAFKSFRNVGFAKESMEIDIQKQLMHVLEYLDKKHRNPISITMTISVALINIIWKYVAGETISEHTMNQYLTYSSTRLRAFSMAGGYLNQWPWLRFIFPHSTGYSIIKEMNDLIAGIINKSIAKHKIKALEGQDYMYSYLKEMQKNKDTYTYDQLLGVCSDILVAASNTGSNTVDFAIIALLRYPKVQDKVYEEIKRVLGDKTPTWADNGRLVYTCAFLCESQRYFTIAPFTGPRRALSDVEVDGYTVPKGSTLLISLGDLHRDEDSWIEPDKFMPERFIDENYELKTSTKFYPFSFGRRRCPSETLAKSFTFTVIVGILQKYKIVCNGPPPSEEPVIGFLAEPEHFTAYFRKRQ